MAEPTRASLVSDGNHDDHVTKHTYVLGNQEEGNVREGDYDVETVERVYRKIDRRIIPGMFTCK